MCFQAPAQEQVRGSQKFKNRMVEGLGITLQFPDGGEKLIIYIECSQPKIKVFTLHYIIRSLKSMTWTRGRD